MRNLNSKLIHLINQSILKGDIIIQPVYHQQELQEYEDNPLIEVLPAILDKEEVVDGIALYPPHKKEESELRSAVRFHLIMRLKNFFQPLNNHFQLERTISGLIRQGYVGRNPMSVESKKRIQFLREARDLSKDINEITIKQIQTLNSKALTYSLLGPSGIGKTTAVERVLLLNPQLVYHQEYRNRPFTYAQVVWLKIECPYDGRVMTFCRAFFMAMDDVLGTTRYYAKYGYSGRIESSMLIDVMIVAANHGLGLLVIDDIQNLNNYSKNKGEILGFLLNLVNTIGVPLVFIGNPSVKALLSKKFGNLRRAGTSGSREWDRLGQDKEWNLFIDTLWHFQWLSNFTPLTPELNTIFYEKSQGIIAIAVTLFILTQARALDRQEKIAAESINWVALNDMKLTADIIESIKNKDLSAIANYNEYEDLINNIKGVCDSTEIDILNENRIKALVKQQRDQQKKETDDLREKVYLQIRNVEVFDSVSNSKIFSIIDDAIKEIGIKNELDIQKKAFQLALEFIEQKKQNNKVKRISGEKKGQVINLYKQSLKEKRDVFELLGENELLKDPFSEFYNVEEKMVLYASLFQ